MKKAASNRGLRLTLSRLGIRLVSAKRLVFASAIAFVAVGIGLAQKAGEQVSESEILKHTSVALPLDQVGRFVDPPDEADLKWNRFATHDPKTAIELREQQKTPDQKAREQMAHMAITQSEDFLKAKAEIEAKKDPKVKAKEDEERKQARFAIEKPHEAAREREKTKDAATRQREQIAAEAILSPREFNAKVQRHKSPELKAREADAIYALSQPRQFLEERMRLKKTGGKKNDDQVIKGPPSKPPGAKEKGQVNPARGAQ